MNTELINRIDNLINSQSTKEEQVDVKLFFMITNLLVEKEMEIEDVENITISIMTLRNCTYTEASNFLSNIIKKYIETQKQFLEINKQVQESIIN